MKMDGVHARVPAIARVYKFKTTCHSSSLSFKETLERNVDNPMFNIDFISSCFFTHFKLQFRICVTDGLIRHATLTNYVLIRLGASKLK